MYLVRILGIPVCSQYQRNIALAIARDISNLVMVLGMLKSFGKLISLLLIMLNNALFLQSIFTTMWNLNVLNNDGVPTIQSWLGK